MINANMAKCSLVNVSEENMEVFLATFLYLEVILK
jgi:hypothetical protein